MNLQLASTEEYIDGQFTGNLGEVLIRCARCCCCSHLCVLHGSHAGTQCALQLPGCLADQRRGEFCCFASVAAAIRKCGCCYLQVRPLLSLPLLRALPCSAGAAAWLGCCQMLAVARHHLSSAAAQHAAAGREYMHAGYPRHLAWHMCDAMRAGATMCCTSAARQRSKKQHEDGQPSWRQQGGSRDAACSAIAPCRCMHPCCCHAQLVQAARCLLLSLETCYLFCCPLCC